MLSFSKVVSAVLFFFVYLNTSVCVEAKETEEESADVVSQVRVHRFPGGTCYSQRRLFEPDTTTYVTTLPELLQGKNVEACVNILKKKKWIATQQEPQNSVNTMREARTQNMVCTRWGTFRTQIFYQVRFSEYDLTGKGKEVEKCISLAVTGKDLAERESDTKFRPAKTF